MRKKVGINDEIIEIEQNTVFYFYIKKRKIATPRPLCNLFLIYVRHAVNNINNERELPIAIAVFLERERKTGHVEIIAAGRHLSSSANQKYSWNKQRLRAIKKLMERN